MGSKTIYSLLRYKKATGKPEPQRSTFLQGWAGPPREVKKEELVEAIAVSTCSNKGLASKSGLHSGFNMFKQGVSTLALPRKSENDARKEISVHSDGPLVPFGGAQLGVSFVEGTFFCGLRRKPRGTHHHLGVPRGLLPLHTRPIGPT